MVLVAVLNLKHFKYFNRTLGWVDSFRLHLDVYGARINTPQDAMEFLTNWARTLRYKYIFLYDKKLSALGYLMAELSRRKVYFCSIPENGYDRAGKMLPLFYDVGSPVRHVYRVIESDNKMRIDGYGLWGTEYIRVDLELNDSVREPIPPSYEAIAREKDIMYTIPHPAADKKTKRLVNDIIELVELSAKHTVVQPSKKA